MSRDFPTINESAAYDDGFKDAEDYWRPKELERIVTLLSDELMKCAHVAVYSQNEDLAARAEELSKGLEAAIRLLAAEEKEKING